MTPLLVWLETFLPPKLAKITLTGIYALCLFHILSSLGANIDNDIIYRDTN